MRHRRFKGLMLTFFDKFVSYFHFSQSEVVSRYREPQLQVGENYSYLFDLRPNICKI